MSELNISHGVMCSTYTVNRLRQATVVTGISLEGEIPYDGDSVADLWSGSCSAREEQGSCFEGSESATDGSRAHNSPLRVW